MINKKISIIIPCFNSQKTLGRCLQSVLASSFKDFEIILVNDGSNDKTTEIGKSFPIKIIDLSKNQGAAVARNKGASLAKGRILLFLDSDILLKKDSLTIVSDFFQKNPSISVLQGIYDRKIASKNLFSIYKHYYHVYKFSKIKGKTILSTSSFCLAVKKEVFEKIGGFDNRFPARSAGEDVDLGLRLRKNGYPIFLERKLKVTHLKSYTFFSFIRSEFIKIASNTKLMLRNKSISQFPISKNKPKKMLNVIFSILLSLLIPISLFYSRYIFILLLITFIILNWKILFLITNEKSILISLAILPIIYLDMLIAQTALIYGFYEYKKTVF